MVISLGDNLNIILDIIVGGSNEIPKLEEPPIYSFLSKVKHIIFNSDSGCYIQRLIARSSLEESSLIVINTISSVILVVLTFVVIFSYFYFNFRIFHSLLRRIIHIAPSLLFIHINMGIVSIYSTDGYLAQNSLYFIFQFIYIGLQFYFMTCMTFFSQYLNGIPMIILNVLILTAYIFCLESNFPDFLYVYKGADYFGRIFVSFLIDVLNFDSYKSKRVYLELFMIVYNLIYAYIIFWILIWASEMICRYIDYFTGNPDPRF